MGFQGLPHRALVCRCPVPSSTHIPTPSASTKSSSRSTIIFFSIHCTRDRISAGRWVLSPLVCGAVAAEEAGVVTVGAGAFPDGVDDDDVVAGIRIVCLLLRGGARRSSVPPLSMKKRKMYFKVEFSCRLD